MTDALQSDLGVHLLAAHARNVAVLERLAVAMENLSARLDFIASRAARNDVGLDVNTETIQLLLSRVMAVESAAMSAGLATASELQTDAARGLARMDQSIAEYREQPPPDE